jgi:uncharacterized membrane protein YozB (DUF420 family)
MFMNELLHRPGFLGTNANFGADATLLVMIFLAALFSLGFYLARQRKYRAHRWVQTSAATLNLIMVLWLMILPFRDFVIRAGAGPQPSIFFIASGIHALVGLFGVGFGAFVVLRANGLMPPALRFRNYKPFMRTAYGLYMAATLLGILVYLTWFVFIPNPPIYK